MKYTLKKTVKAISEHKFEVITDIYREDGSTGRLSGIVFDTEEDARNEATERLNWWGSNLVCMGIESEVIENKTYYFPTFNVWD